MAYSTTTTKRTGKQKIQSTSAVIELSLARQANDPLYKRMMLYKKLYKLAKQQLIQKYKSKGMKLAREKAAKYKRK